MKKYIFSLVCLCCALLPALEGQAHEYPDHPELRKSDANIIGNNPKISKFNNLIINKSDVYRIPHFNRETNKEQK